MKVGKPQSKRVPVRLRHKIQKASAAKQRKEKKSAKKNPEWRSRIKKDPGIPNLFPYKDRILHEIEEKKRLKEEEIQRKKEENRLRQQQLKAGGDAVMGGTEGVGGNEEAEEMLDFEEYSDDAMDDVDESNPMAALLASAQARAKEYDPEEDPDEMDSDASSFAGFDDGADNEPRHAETKPAKKNDSSRKAFNKSFQDLLSSVDVVLYVLDARDPLGTRSRDTEVAITSDPDKRLIFVLNKIDLIPPPTLKAWMKHLKRSFPVLPLRATTPAANAKTFDHKSLTPSHTAQTLFKALKTYAATRGANKSLSVGVVGYPNVGKSSVVNALVSQLGGKRLACPVGAEAGITTSLREVKIDTKLKLIDSPGIVFPSSSLSSEGAAPAPSKDKKQAKIDEQARLVLLNAIPPREIEDPAPAVTLLLSRMTPSQTSWDQLLSLYDIPYIEPTSADLTNEFLIHVARKRGRLGRGGVPNIHAAGMAVVSDWRDGRIPGWVEPPTTDEEATKQSDNGESVNEKKVVDGWAEEFKIEGLWE